MFTDYNRLVMENRMKEMRKYAQESNNFGVERKLKKAMKKKQLFQLQLTKEVG